MARRSSLLTVIAVASLLGACGSSSSNGVETAERVVDETIGAAQAPAATDAAPAQVGSIGDAVQVAVGALNGADAAACDLDHRALADASELYLALNGSLPANQDALVEAKVLTEPSTRFEIAADGAIVPSAGSPCL